MNKQQLIAKYGKKFACKNEARPILEGVHYGIDGTVFVTDAKYAIRIRNGHKFEHQLTLHAVNGSPIEGIYPDVSKVFPSSFDNEIRIRRKELEQLIKYVRCAADVASRLDKKHPVVILSTNPNGETYLRINNKDGQLELSAFFGNAVKLEPSKRSLNAEYLHTALSVFSDSEYCPDLVVKFCGPMDPIVLTDEKDIDVLILPYRVAPEN